MLGGIGVLNGDRQFLEAGRILHIEADHGGKLSGRDREKWNGSFQQDPTYAGLRMVDRDFDPEHFALLTAELST